jgi:arsenate reductase (thioredoxin)
MSYLIVVCGDAEETCPRIWPGVHDRLFWPFDDPAAATGTEQEKLAAFRRVRDEIDAKIRAWLAESSTLHTAIRKLGSTTSFG